MTSMPDPLAPSTPSTSTVRMYFDPDASEFARRNNLIEHVAVAAQLASKHYRPVEPMYVEMDFDAEVGDEQLIIHVTVEADAGDLMRRGLSFRREWVGATTKEVLRRIAIVEFPL